MGWGRDCGCWKPEKPEVVVTQEPRDRLSDVVKAEPGGKKRKLMNISKATVPFLISTPTPLCNRTVSYR